MTRLPAIGVALVFALVTLSAAQVSAQVPPIVAPPNIVLPNFNSQQPGMAGSLEAGAMIARGDDASATWYNPAGLSRVDSSSMVAGGGMVQWQWVSPNAFPTHAYAASNLPPQIGLAWKEPFDYVNWTASLNFSSTTYWQDDLSTELQVGSAQAPERFSYAASSRFSRYVASVGAGYTPDKKLRFGGSIDIELTRMNEVQSVNDRILGPPTLTSLLVSSYSRADFVHLRGTFGMQYDISDKLFVGGVLKTPGVTLTHGGQAGFDATLSGTLDSGPISTNLSYYDGGPTLQYKVPFEFAAGVAYVAGKATVEGDFRLTQGFGTYEYFAPNRTITGIVQRGSDQPYGVEGDFRTYSIDSKSVFDVRIGARYELSPQGKLTAHAGFATNNSPVGANDEVFQKVNIRHLTVGISGGWAHFVYAGGIDYQWGTTPLYDVYSAQNGQIITTTTDVKGFGLVYSLGVKF